MNFDGLRLQFVIEHLFLSSPKGDLPEGFERGELEVWGKTLKSKTICSLKIKVQSVLGTSCCLEVLDSNRGTKTGRDPLAGRQLIRECVGMARLIT